MCKIGRAEQEVHKTMQWWWSAFRHRIPRPPLYQLHPTLHPSLQCSCNGLIAVQIDHTPSHLWPKCHIQSASQEIPEPWLLHDHLWIQHLNFYTNCNQLFGRREHVDNSLSLLWDGYKMCANSMFKKHMESNEEFFLWRNRLHQGHQLQRTHHYGHQQVQHL